MTGVETTMDTKLSTWLNYECKSRGWSHRELAKRAGVSGQMVSGVISGDRNAGWDFCAAIAKPLGKSPEEVFRIARLLPPEQHGEDEPALIHHYRQLTPPNQRAALAMLRGLAGQPSPAAQPPAPGADADDVCRLLARLDSDRLQQAAGFIRWLSEQPGAAAGPAPATWEDVEQELANLPNEKEKTAVLNVLRRHARQLGYDLRALGDTDSESDQEPRPGLSQGSLF